MLNLLTQFKANGDLFSCDIYHRVKSLNTYKLADTSFTKFWCLISPCFERGLFKPDDMSLQVSDQLTLESQQKLDGQNLRKPTYCLVGKTVEYMFYLVILLSPSCFILLLSEIKCYVKILWNLTFCYNTSKSRHKNTISTFRSLEVTNSHLWSDAIVWDKNF